MSASDSSSPPPKPKPGSLRDRIAAFEKKPEQNAHAPPAPRPKPGHVQWNPRRSSPPPPPINSGSEGSDQVVHGGDAKESISTGGMSLKERMAALQGRGAFAAPPPPAPAPKPASERKWKPPPAPVPVSPPSDNDNEGEAEHHEPATSAAPEPPSSEAAEGEKTEETHQEGESATEATDDPEEEERKRRAAIAARMARLGGARIGMGPPVFAPKPRAPPKESPPPPQHAESAEEAAASASDNPDAAVSPTDPSLLSPDSGSGASGRSMPIPTGPRRAAPPRRRPPKSPGAASGELPPVPSEGEGESEGTVAVSEKKPDDEGVTSPGREEEEEAPEEETEEEAAARRKRIADRIAKSGGINPFAGPRPVQIDEEEHGRDEEKAVAAETTEIPSKSETSIPQVEEAEVEVEAPPRSPSEPDEEPESTAKEPEPEPEPETGAEENAPPLPPKLTHSQADEANTESAKKSPPVTLPTKEDESAIPVVDLSQPSQVSLTLDDEPEKHGEVEEKHSVDITEAADEYRDVRSVEDRDDESDGEEGKEGKGKDKDEHARKDSQVLPAEK